MPYLYIPYHSTYCTLEVIAELTLPTLYRYPLMTIHW